MGPAKLSVRRPGAGREPIGDDHPVAAGVLAQRGFRGVMPSQAMDAEGGGPGGHPDPEPGLLAGLSPAGLIDMHRAGLADGLDDLGHRAGRQLAGPALQLGDHTGVIDSAPGRKPLLTVNGYQIFSRAAESS